MFYLLYILVGLLIFLGVNLMITGLLAVHDMYTCGKEEPTFATFKKYFVKNNNIPTKVSDLFN